MNYLKEKNKNQMEEYNKSINEFEINIKNLLNVLSTNLLVEVEEIKKYEIIKNIDEENKKFIQNVIGEKDVSCDEIEN